MMEKKFEILCDDECGKLEIEEWGRSYSISIIRLEKFPFLFRFKRAMKVLFNKIPYNAGDIVISKEHLLDFIGKIEKELKEEE